MFSFGLGFLRGALSICPNYGIHGICCVVETREVGVMVWGCCNVTVCFLCFQFGNSCFGARVVGGKVWI